MLSDLSPTQMVFSGPTQIDLSLLVIPPTTPPSSSPQMQTRSRHKIVKPNPKYAFTSAVTPTKSPLPQYYNQALADPNWNAAMTDEFGTLIKIGTWELVPKPPGVNIVNCIWLFRHKLTSTGALEIHEARLVANGKSQEVGIDCDETFNPVVRPATIRTVMSLALARKWIIHQLDVKKMLFFMVTFMRQFICGSLLALLIVGFLIMFVY